jgi:hypothetical protein
MALAQTSPAQNQIYLNAAPLHSYIGRAELPESLKALFRPITVMVPDRQLIMENMLMAEGFVEAKMLVGWAEWGFGSADAGHGCRSGRLPIASHIGQLR